MPRQFVVVNGTRLRVSEHAWIRYQERVRPSLSLQAARTDLARVIDAAAFGPRPEYALGIARAEERWLVLGDVAFVVQGDVIVNCVARGLVGDREHEQKAQAKRLRRSIRAARRTKTFGKVRARERARRDNLRGALTDE